MEKQTNVKSRKYNYFEGTINYRVENGPDPSTRASDHDKLRAAIQNIGIVSQGFSLFQDYQLDAHCVKKKN